MTAGPGMGRPPGALERQLLRLALATVPSAFRRRFADAMAQTVRDGLVERRGLRRVGFLWRSLTGVVWVGMRERLAPTPLPPSSPSSHDRSPLVDVVIQELRFAFRALRRRPGFAAVAVLTLALGIGANTAIFSVVDAVLLRPLPYPDPDGLFMTWAYDTTQEPGRSVMSQPDIESVRELGAIEDIQGYATSTFTLTGGEEPVQVEGARVTGGLLDVMGLSPYQGRDIRQDENVADGPTVAMVGYGFWRDRLGGNPDVIGSTLEIAEVTYQIVGVAPPGFDFPDKAQVWIPYRLNPEGCGRGCHIFRAVTRLAPGATQAQAGQEMDALAASLSDTYPDSNFQQGFRLESLADYRVGDVRRGLLVLLGAVGVVLLIACANVANLLLVRGATRRSEVAVRTALGAAPRRVLASVLAESLVLAITGALLGLGLARLGIAALHFVPEGTVPRLNEVGLDGRVLGFTLLVTAGVTLLFGLAPALHLARTSPARDLGGAARSGQDRREARSRSLLLAGEVALSVVLLTGAGLFIRSLSELTSVDMGFSEREVVRFTLSIPSSRYDTLPVVSGFYRELESRLAALPGVESVGSAYGPPMGRGNITGGVEIEGRPEPEPGEETYASIHPVTPGFMSTLGMQVLRGRGIEATDQAETEPVAVVNETFVRQNFPNEDPIGQRVYITASFGYGSPTWTIVGVAKDIRQGLTADPVAAVFVPHAQFGPGFMTVHLRGRAGATGLVQAARDVVHSMDPNVPLARVETLSQAVRRETATTRFYMSLVGLFAALAVVLAAVGLYGVVSYLVSRRMREIGIRVALGAATARVRWMVVLQGLRPALLGLIIGVGASLVGGKVVASLLYQVQPRDPAVLAGVVALLLIVTVLATLLPARRATRVDPVEALRTE